MAEQRAGQGTAHMERLPPEMINEVLSRLDDISSLRSAVLACRYLYDSFFGARSAITARVLIRQLGAGVLPEAIAAEAASRNDDYASFFSEHYRQRQQAPALSHACRRAASIARLSAYVQRFADRFVDSSLQLADAPAPATCSERARVQRALYRFETFNRLSRRHRPSQIAKHFLASLAPWELEQLGCVHDFLFRQVSPVYDDMALHDVVWGEFQIEPAAQKQGSFKVQRILSWGLERLYEIATADTYETRLAALTPRPGESQRPGPFLHRVLKWVSSGAFRNGRGDAPLAEYSEAALAASTTPPFFQDPDSGPRDVWLWAHASDRVWRSFYQPEKAPARAWGYVMWDRQRLDDMQVLASPWQPPPPSLDSVSIWGPHEVTDEWKATWATRSRIYRAGGRGYWAPGDATRIVWPARSRRSQPQSRTEFAGGCEIALSKWQAPNIELLDI